MKGELTENDKLVYVNNVLLGKLLESETLLKQAQNTTKQQFANSPDLAKALTDAIIDALDAHNEMSTQALSSDAVQKGLREILLGQRSCTRSCGVCDVERRAKVRARRST